MSMALARNPSVPLRAISALNLGTRVGTPVAYCSRGIYSITRAVSFGREKCDPSIVIWMFSLSTRRSASAVSRPNATERAAMTRVQRSTAIWGKPSIGKVFAPSACNISMEQRWHTLAQHGCLKLCLRQEICLACALSKCQYMSVCAYCAHATC